ncbi:hypothetical protein FE257_006403 [Aspergillus nanangensis]|uniref:SMP-30/Gluconolactonase/LRE-like region domain-containing protein n=1 Tax=Aspergillus nanangensis TaxID=2582783 RepID=A0AAD4CXI1_ASPNN|nr:hypothetical protein FE257_006403 [Aspergillus nanangensis]
MFTSTSTINLLFGFLCLILGTTHAAAFPTTETPISTIYQFEKGSWLENLAVGPTDDSILATRVDGPYLYRIHLPANPHANASTELVHTFSHFQSLAGITEYEPNAFAVIAGNLSLTDLAPGNFSIYSVRFPNDPPPHHHHPVVQKITDLPNSQFFLNGMTTLATCEEGEEESTVLFCDSLTGRVYRLSPQTGIYGLVLEDSTMKPSQPGNLGVNGIRTVTIGHDTYLYYDNSDTTTINRVRIDPATGRATGPYTTLARGHFADDLVFDHETGDVYVAAQKDNVLVRVTPDGHEAVVAGAPDRLTVAGPTSAVFGKGRQSRTLYVTTTGGSAAPINGTLTEGAKLMAFQVDCL